MKPRRRRHQRRRNTDPSLHNAREFADYLAAGHPLTSRSHPWMAPGEGLLLTTTADIWRYRAADDVSYSTPGYVAFGRPSFLFGAALGHLAVSAAARRRAERDAAPQWRNYGPHACLLSTHRALFHLDGAWEGTNLADIYDVQPQLSQHTLDLYYGTEPIRLVGTAAPWMAVAVLYLKHGHRGLQAPGLQPLHGLTPTGPR